ncbi:MAG: dimethylarginine dimethylaminohydrolase family protein [Miltoncostaeaceae bacterium]
MLAARPDLCQRVRALIMDGVHVDFEFGHLREAIVGMGVMRYPDVERAAWAAEALRVHPEDEAARARERSGMHSRDLPKYGLVETENDELIQVLEHHGVVVHRPDPLTDELVAANYGREWLVNGCIQTYGRDPIFVVGDNVIELAPGGANRRAEILGYRRLFAERLAGSGARWRQMPAIDVSAIGTPGYDKERQPVLEGGDLLVFGSTVLAGTSLNRAVGSSVAGVRWLSSLLAPQGHRLERVPLADGFLHLDVCMSTPRDGLAIVCPDAFPEGLPPLLDGWDLIEVSREQARLLACNGLPLDPENYILGHSEAADGREVQAALEERGIAVHRVGFGNHTEDGGSIRCATHPLVRRLQD